MTDSARNERGDGLADASSSRPEDAPPSDAASGGAGRDDAATASAGRRPATLRLLVAILALEAAGLAAVTVLLVIEQFAQTPFSRASSVALVVLAAIATALVAVLARQTWRGSRRIRGAAITWQVLQLAAAVVLLEGDMASWLGWALVALSLAGIACVLAPATRRALGA